MSSNVLATLPWDKPNPFILPVSVASSDIDSYQHVNNSVYSRWVDDCARAHSDSVGVLVDEAASFGYGMAVRTSQYVFLAAAYLGDDLVVGVWITETDHKLRIKREFQIMRVTDQVTLVRATVDYVCINIHTGKPAKMPTLFKDKYLPTV